MDIDRAANAYHEIEGIVASFAAMNSEALQARNSLDFFSQTLEINSQRHVRVSNYRLRPPRLTLLALNEPGNFACLSENVGIHKVVSIGIDELISGRLAETRIPVLFTNNQICSLIKKVGFRGAVECRKLWNNSLWLVHDYDNHHWYEMSMVSELLADFYFPAHPFVGGRLTNFSSSFKTYIPIGSTQWRLSFIEQNGERILNQERLNDPLGMHNYYPKFVIRNRVVKTLNTHFRDVCLIDVENYHNQTEIERFDQWVTRKCHFIIPVENDLPIRFFDAIITGGIPIIPESLVPTVHHYNIPTDFYVTYSLHDIFNPDPLINRAVLKFDHEGQKGIRRRISYALRECHIEHSIEKIMNRILCR